MVPIPRPATPSRQIAERHYAAMTLGLTAWMSSAHPAPEGPMQEYLPNQPPPAIIPAEKGSWVVAPIPVSNPTLGSGLELVALYLHPESEGAAGAPNATTGFGGLYTNEGTWFLGAFHQGALWNDRLRILAAAGTGLFELSYFGTSSDSFLSDHPVRFRFDTNILYLRAQVRVPGTENWFLGPTYLFNQADVRFKPGGLVPELPPTGPDLRIAGLGIALTYDTSNDTYYPTAGTRAELSWTDYGAHWGGDFEYTKFGGHVYRYLGAGDRLTIALALDLKGSSGNVPFYDQPYIDVRGYERGRFSNDYTLSLRSEARYKFRPRWGIVAFVDTGWAHESLGGMLGGDRGRSAGAGLRWQAAKDQTLHIGLDAAATEDGSVVFIQLGERF